MDEIERRPARPGRWWVCALAWALALVALLPFAWAAWLAQKPRDRVDDAWYYLVESKRLPEQKVREQIGISPRPLRVSLINSVIVSTACAVLGVVLSSLAGYAFAKKRFAGKAALFDLVLASMALPAAILMMPLFRLTVQLGLYDTLLGLILPFAVTGFGIFYMRYAISAVPDSLIDAARVDGLSEVGALFRVVVPSIRGSVVTLTALLFITTWNSFVLPHALIGSPETMTVSVLLGRLVHDFGGLMWNDIMVVVIAGMLPVLIVFVVLDRYVLRGLAAVGEERTGPGE